MLTSTPAEDGDEACANITFVLDPQVISGTCLSVYSVAACVTAGGNVLDQCDASVRRRNFIDVSIPFAVLLISFNISPSPMPVA